MSSRNKYVSKPHGLVVDALVFLESVEIDQELLCNKTGNKSIVIGINKKKAKIRLLHTNGRCTVSDARGVMKRFVPITTTEQFK